MSEAQRDPEPPDENDDDDDDENDDDGDDDDNGDEQEEGRGAAPAPRELRAPTTHVAVPIAAAAVESPASVPAPDPPRAFRSTVSRDPRAKFFDLSDPRVSQIAVLDRHGRRLIHVRPPFPDPIERWIASTYGVGKYRIMQRDDTGKHLGSRTVTVREDPGKTLTFSVSDGRAAVPPEAPNGNGNGSAPPSPAAFTPVATAAAAIPAGTDWKLALVTTGIPLLATLITSSLEAIARRPEQKSALTELAEVAKLLQVPNEERALLFKEGMKLATSITENMPRGERHDGDGFNIRDVLSGLGEIVQAFRGAQPPSAAAPAASPVNRAPAPPTAQITAGGSAESVEKTGERYVEQLLVTEIHRAVGRGDTPECFIVLIDAYLPPLVVAWLESTPEDEVLAELPKRFPNHTEYLKGEQVQAFLRSALKMLREDAGEVGGTGVPRTVDPAATS